MNNTILLITVLIILSSYLITDFVDKSYSFPKLAMFLIFYYALIIFGAILGSKHLKNGKMIGSIGGFILSIILWFLFGKNAKKT